MPKRFSISKALIWLEVKCLSLVLILYPSHFGVIVVKSLLSLPMNVADFS